MLTRRLATAGFLVATLLVMWVGLGGSARAASGMCEEIEDTVANMTVGPEIEGLEVFGPEPEPVPSIAALGLRDPRERFLCWGNPLTDDPSCWSNDPAGSPKPVPVYLRVVRDAAVTTILVLPEPATARVPFAGVVLGVTHPGYARGIDRPPRLAA